MSTIDSQTLIESPTARELDVLTLYCWGYSHKQIADRLDISKRTVETHVYSLFGKFHVEDRAGLVQAAMMYGFVEMSVKPVYDTVFFSHYLIAGRTNRLRLMEQVQRVVFDLLQTALNLESRRTLEVRIFVR